MHVECRLWGHTRTLARLFGQLGRARPHRQVSDAPPLPLTNTYVIVWRGPPEVGDTRCRSYRNLGTNAGIVSKSCLAARAYARIARHFKTGAGLLLLVRRIWRCSQPLYLLQRPFLLWRSPSLSNKVIRSSFFWIAHLKHSSLWLFATQEMRVRFYVFRCSELETQTLIRFRSLMPQTTFKLSLITTVYTSSQARRKS